MTLQKGDIVEFIGERGYDSIGILDSAPILYTVDSGHTIMHHGSTSGVSLVEVERGEYIIPRSWPSCSDQPIFDSHKFKLALRP